MLLFGVTYFHSNWGLVWKQGTEDLVGPPLKRDHCAYLPASWLASQMLADSDCCLTLGKFLNLPEVEGSQLYTEIIPAPQG